MKTKQTLSSLLYGSIRAMKHQELAYRLRKSNGPVLLLDVENYTVEEVTDNERGTD